MPKTISSLKRLATISALALMAGCLQRAERTEPILEMIRGSGGDYQGMIGTDTFSLRSGHGHGSVNTFYSASDTNILWHGDKYDVLEVTPERIKLRKTEGDK